MTEREQQLTDLIKESPAWPGEDLSVDEVLIFLGEWYRWREQALELIE